MNANHKINRRSVLTAAATVPLAALPAIGAVAPDPHVEWFKQWKAAHDEWCVAATGDDEDWDMSTVARTAKEQVRLSDLIRTTPAKTIHGIQVQLDYMFADFFGGGSPGVDADRECVALKTVCKAMKAMVA